MGYFPNGTSGMDYQDRYCERCINWRDLGDGRGAGCPIWDLHLLNNYTQVEVERFALDHFIPRDEGDLRNEQCRMFSEARKEVVCPRCELEEQGQMRISS